MDKNTGSVREKEQTEQRQDVGLGDGVGIGIRINAHIFANANEDDPFPESNGTNVENPSSADFHSIPPRQEQRLEGGGDDDGIHVLDERFNENRPHVPNGFHHLNEIEQPRKDLNLNTANFQCQFCHQILVGVANLSSHLRQVHRARVISTCNLCNETFNQSRHLIKHLLKHQQQQRQRQRNRRSGAKRPRAKPNPNPNPKSKTKTGSNSKSQPQNQHQDKDKDEDSDQVSKVTRSKSEFSSISSNVEKDQDQNQPRAKIDSNKKIVAEKESKIRKQKFEVEFLDLKVKNLTGKENDEDDHRIFLPPSKIRKTNDNVDFDIDMDMTPTLPVRPVSSNSPEGLFEDEDIASVASVASHPSPPASPSSPPPALSPTPSSQSKNNSPLGGGEEDDWGWDTDLPSQTLDHCDLGHGDQGANSSERMTDKNKGQGEDGPFPFACSKCPLRFRSKDLLRIHQTYHTLLIHVKFRCERANCYRYFDDAQVYQRHFNHNHVRRRTKGVVRRFVCARRKKANIQCKYCPKRFRHQYAVTRHQTTHFQQKQKIYVCSEPECGLTFNLQASLKMHVIQNHRVATALPQHCIKIHSDSEPEPEPDQDPLALPEDVTDVADEKTRRTREREIEVVLVDDEDDDEVMEIQVKHRVTLSGKPLRSKIVPVKRHGVVIEDPQNFRILRPPSSGNRGSHSCPQTDCEHVSQNLSELKVHLDSVHPDYKPDAIDIPALVCPICSKQFPINKHLERHISSVHGSVRAYSCPHCVGKSFATRRHLQSHLDYHKRAAAHVCPMCHKAFKIKNHLIVHIRRHTNERPFACVEPNCSRSFLSSCELRRHGRCHSETSTTTNLSLFSTKGVSPIQHKCDRCDKLFLARRSLLRHIHAVHGLAKKGKETGDRDNEERGSYKCDLCPMSFSTLIGWARHKLKHDENTDILCNHCGRQFATPETLSFHKDQRHWKAEEAGKERQNQSHVCDICGKKLSSLSGFKTHMERHTGDSCICDECGKPCITKGDLKFHKFTHLKEKPFQCPFCPYKYNHPSNIYHHMLRDHTHSSGEGFIESELALSSIPLEERAFICPEDNCAEVFTSELCLKQHGLYHKGVRKTPCKKCGEKFICKYDVYVHSTKAHRETDFKCEHCGKEFKGKVALDSHVRYNHTGEAPYACSQCERKFKTNGDLSYHMVAVHTGNYRFCCEICGKKVVTKGNLNAHMRVHTDARLYNCVESGCDASFKSSSLLKKHLFKEHGKKDNNTTIIRRRKNANVDSINSSSAGAVSSSESIAGPGRFPKPHSYPDCRIPCEVCGKKFGSAEALEKHEREAHGEEEDEEEQQQQQEEEEKSMSPSRTTGNVEAPIAEQDTQRILSSSLSSTSQSQLSQYFLNYDQLGLGIGMGGILLGSNNGPPENLGHNQNQGQKGLSNPWGIE